MGSYNLWLVIVAVAILAVAWLPSLLKEYPLSYPILFVIGGWLLYQLPLPLPDPSPLLYPELTTHLTELCVIIALTGTGLKIDRRFSLRGWRLPIRLVWLTMVVTIAVFAVIAWGWAGWPLASALLLAAGLAPTDPVLAGDVQVGDPNEGGEDSVRFALTAEAGLNDGMAFPFVYLAITLAQSAVTSTAELTHWALYDLAYRVGVGVLGGWLSGQLLSYLIFGLPQRISIKTTAYGFVALAVTLISYGLTELAHGYGFLAVFIAAITIRSRERTHEYHTYMHAFTDQIERLLIALLLLLFGGAIAKGILLPLTWQDAVLGLLLVLIIRPLGGWLTLWRTGARGLKRWIIASFGIRGIGSLFYIAFGLQHASFADPARIWALTGWTILISVFLHGISSTPVMKRLDRRTTSASDPVNS
ncbi:cation:proton antiporter [Spirosoma utsteinense]|uniref:NhaP-type Na+/H+ or K+/H+ antiporter n=1 Tax=Spirosoma utsteinense TaxID=2585773 RepID=A0ABR6WC51_9BACT|nr:cation:proton antiporter [Spirosoma utsteinense]MBC3788731.1 NhaP-type Na+/H+ or K+/H+ antiporter [Spirosoma utsteinense]MBC3794150.1 NhaP-type Na+/H+ or K+/H+ antiporter [Spirosoma utsteinense]